MAKKTKAKSKAAKTTKTKTARKPTKAKPAKKTTKYNKTKKPTEASDTDPCAAQQQAFEDAQLAVDNLKNEINDPDIPPAERVKAEEHLRTATIKLTAAQTALDRCRRQHAM